MTAHTITEGDTRTPLGVYLEQGGRPVDLASKTVKFEMYPEGSSTATVEETETGVTKHPTQTFTLDADNDWLYAVDHKAEDGRQVVLSTAGSLSSTGVSAATRYFVVNKQPNCFQLSLTPGGTVIDITGAGTGTHSFYTVGAAQYVFQEAHSDGRYRAWFSVHDGDAFDHFPVDENGLTVVIKAVPSA